MQVASDKGTTEDD